MMEVVVTNDKLDPRKVCNAPVKSSLPANQHTELFFHFAGRMPFPVTEPCNITEGKTESIGL